jgi:hypothetical protein
VAQPTREQAVRTLREGQERLDALLSGLTEDQIARPGAIGGGDWSARDLIGHLETWEALALEALGQWRGGARPRIEDIFAAPTGVDDLNAAMVERNRTLPPDDVVRGAGETHVRLIEEIETMSDGEWSAKAFYPTPANRRGRLVTLLGSILGAPQQPFGHAFAHLPDLEAYVDSLRRP